MNRVELSVGLTQDWANCEVRKAFLFWLDNQKFRDGTDDNHKFNARHAMNHIFEIEALVKIERYATLAVIADDMRKELLATRDNNTYENNKGYQAAINLVVSKLEDIDIETQAATSIAELQKAAVRGAQELCGNNEDYQAIGNFADALTDGCT